MTYCFPSWTEKTCWFNFVKICIANITGDCMFSFMNQRNMLLEVIPLIKIIIANITCDKSLSFMNWWNMLLQEIFFIKINPANITLKELTNFQGFLIQKQVHTIFVLLEYYFFHLQKMTWWDLILHHQSLECFIFSALLNFLIDCRDKMFSTFRQSEVLSTKKQFLDMW